MGGIQLVLWCVAIELALIVSTLAEIADILSP